MSDLLERDDDGYPTEEAEQKVREFKGDARDLLTLIKTGWWMPDWGWHEEDITEDGDTVHRYNISTGGWSGNETLIWALEQNMMFWIMAWVQSRRGGHYIFEVPAPSQPTGEPSAQEGEGI